MKTTSKTQSKTIAQGAEAKIILSDNFIIKDRIKKNYRIKEIDKTIRKRRTKSEKKLLIKANKLINSPLPLDDNSEYQIKMPYIKGKKLSENLDNMPAKKQLTIMKQVGKDIAKLHDNEIIHGDLTTSNMILVKDKVFFIDFGLGYISTKIEDKAVDLHLLKQALEAKHYKNYEELWKAIEQGYNSSKQAKAVLNQLIKVEKRGRYKH